MAGRHPVLMWRVDENEDGSAAESESRIEIVSDRNVSRSVSAGGKNAPGTGLPGPWTPTAAEAGHRLRPQWVMLLPRLPLQSMSVLVLVLSWPLSIPVLCSALLFPWEVLPFQVQHLLVAALEMRRSLG